MPSETTSAQLLVWGYPAIRTLDVLFDLRDDSLMSFRYVVR